ncbi:hypothetical protein D7003_02580 [Arthrobacter oryzae]|uniref:Uncharacterized protein n=1 Tax=Arthrobacter oryzae TaxID=409290 RepID=A0A3N0C8C2_9MICC|nr:hypothetical protein D7003_02580 [Arthrobacter oryzae]
MRTPHARGTGLYPESGRRRNGEVGGFRAGLPLAEILNDLVRDLWARDLDQVLLRGRTWLNEALFLRAP